MNDPDSLTTAGSDIADFCRIFATEMDSLFSLALCLTGDSKTAEACVVRGLESCLHGEPVSTGSARRLSRWSVITQAVMLLASNDWLPPAVSVGENLRRESSVLSAVVQLPPFERCAFVVSVLEGNAVNECAALLHCSSGVVVEARARAIKLLAEALEGNPAFREPYFQCAAIPA